MEKSEPKQGWILLIHQLPPKPTNLRVRIWRKLQKLGAVAINCHRLCEGARSEILAFW